MTKEQLLKPRYKVIANYPGCTWQIGEILDRDWGWNGNDENGFKYHVSDFPHLFKPLRWYDDRDNKDYPEYVEVIKDIPYYGFKIGQIVKVDEIKKGINNKMNEYSITLLGRPLISLDSVIPSDLTPNK